MAGMALDVLEQKRRAFFIGGEIGDGGGFEIGIDLGADALEFAHGFDFRQPLIESAGIGPRLARLALVRFETACCCGATDTLISMVIHP